MTTTALRADQTLITFYDIESLSNVFTLCAYTPPRDGSLADVEIFTLIDDDNLAQMIDTSTAGNRYVSKLLEHIGNQNPALPAWRAHLHDLRSFMGNERLAMLFGLSDAPHVCDSSSESSYTKDYRPVCDTDTDYNSTRHPLLAGYNSYNYDTTMLAYYLAEVFEPMRHAQSAYLHAMDEDRARMHALIAQDMQHSPDVTAQLDALVETMSHAISPITAAHMRAHNDRLFSEKYIDYMPRALDWKSPAGRIRQSMLHSGRHLDVARLNELQQKVGLKRLLGMLGYQIKESDKLTHDSTITSFEELCDLLAYNVSDCVGLSQLFSHSLYSSAFDLKAGLLTQYSETRFEHDGRTVRKDRLTIDSSSARFVSRILAPDTALTDIPAVSFDYPHPAVASERGITPVNVLDECVRFFEDDVAPDRKTNDDQRKAYEQFMEIVQYYKSIEGKNFNPDLAEELPPHLALPPASKEDPEVTNDSIHVLHEIPKRPNNLPYFHADGSPSSCFATFSYGGIHGAEADMKAYHTMLIRRQIQEATIGIARETFKNDAAAFLTEAKRQHGLLVLPDGSTVDKTRVLLGSDPARVRYRKPKANDPVHLEQRERAMRQVPNPADLLAMQRPASMALDVISNGFHLQGKLVLDKTTMSGATFKDHPTIRVPELFTLRDDGSTKLHPKYARTSAGVVVHEDFTSYYPSLLSNMRAFYNPDLGEDRYARIFQDKERYGKLMKQPGIDPVERERLSVLRAGTKLILNSASGAGDAAHKTSIRMNNRIISMRIIGQLFSWRIGQAQTLRGGRIISTNTDGLYSIISAEGEGFTEKVNNEVLAEQQVAIGVDIEPEPLFLISKDSNNRLELAPRNGAPLHVHEVIRSGDGEEGFDLSGMEIVSASGGTLACHAGPRPDKSLAHPAIIDHTLARYLIAIVDQYGEKGLSQPFDEALGTRLLEEAHDRGAHDPVGTLLLFQTMVAASRSSITYPFAADPLTAEDPEVITPAMIRNAHPLQMINRIFIVKAGTAHAVSLHSAGAWTVTPESRKRRARQGERSRVHQDLAVRILRAHGWAMSSVDVDHAAEDGRSLTLLPEDQDITLRKISNVDQHWPVLICNEDLHLMTATHQRMLLDALDLKIYRQLLDDAYTKNWKN